MTGVPLMELSFKYQVEFSYLGYEHQVDRVNYVKASLGISKVF